MNYNKTGLQPILRPVERVHYLGGRVGVYTSCYSVLDLLCTRKEKRKFANYTVFKPFIEELHGFHSKNCEVSDHIPQRIIVDGAELPLFTNL